MENKEPKPNFDNLDNPETIIEDIQEDIQEVMGKNEKFPIEVFPQNVQTIINEINDKLNFPVDFSSVSILYAVSVAMGNSFCIEVKKGWIDKAILYIAIVGRAGTNKSHPLSFALKPLEDLDAENFKTYEKENKEYKRISKLSKDEKEAENFDEMEEPEWKQSLVSDFTPEALVRVLKHNYKGVGVYSDELKSWIENFNRYNKGSEEQFWLSVWSGKSIRVNRKTVEPIFVKKPFISVIGTIQPLVLDEISKGRTDNGFFDRILFAYPENLKKEYISTKELNPQVETNWNIFLTNILNKSNSIDIENPHVFKWSEEAKTVFFDYQKKITDLCNNTEDEAIVSIYAKIETYVTRFAIILELMQFASSKKLNDKVSPQSIKSAIKLAEYFKSNALKVNSNLMNKTPIDRLNSKERIVYESLPDKFKTGDGVVIAKKNGMPKRTFMAFKNNKKLFDKITHGEYSKRY